MNFGPAIPYVDLPELTLLPPGALGNDEAISIKPFGTLVAAGVYLGAFLALRQGRRLGLSTAALSSFIVWVVLAGFIGGHVLELLFYTPSRVLEAPLELLELWSGQSSFGGFIGAMCGMWAWRIRHRSPGLPYADVVASAFPVGWLLGRAGCSIVHDHPGLPSSAWYAVQYPGGGRLDLGLFEMVLVAPLAIAFLVLRRIPRPWGFYASGMAIYYAPLRFGLDFLRARDEGGADVRYAGLTPAQWGCVPLLVLGLWLAQRVFSGARSAEATAIPPPPKRFRARRKSALGRMRRS
jgi:phosphatidylglycerol:prolipoprotein diacylglycerol transferase